MIDETDLYLVIMSAGDDPLQTGQIMDAVPDVAIIIEDEDEWLAEMQRLVDAGRVRTVDEFRHLLAVHRQHNERR